MFNSYRYKEIDMMPVEAINKNGVWTCGQQNDFHRPWLETEDFFVIVPGAHLNKKKILLYKRRIRILEKSRQFHSNSLDHHGWQG
jgi:hypothetical protein